MTTTDLSTTLHDITAPLRLAVGSHVAGTGKGCAMNVVSWMNGDTKITSFPDCSDPLLTRIVQSVNDTICTHTHALDRQFLCPACSVKVLELAFRTVGTGTLSLTQHEREEVWVRVALDQARSVQHLIHELDRPWAERALTVVQEWLDDQSLPVRVIVDCVRSRPSFGSLTAGAVLFAAYHVAVRRIGVGDFTGAALFGDGDLVCNDQRFCVSEYTLNAVAHANDLLFRGARTVGGALICAHQAIDTFDRYTRHVAPAPDPVATVDALTRMSEVSG